MKKKKKKNRIREQEATEENPLTTTESCIFCIVNTHAYMVEGRGRNAKKKKKKQPEDRTEH